MRYPHDERWEMYGRRTRDAVRAKARPRIGRGVANR